MEQYSGTNFLYSDASFSLHGGMQLSIEDMYGQEYCTLQLDGVLVLTIRKCQFNDLSITVPGSYLMLLTVLGSQVIHSFHLYFSQPADTK